MCNIRIARIGHFDARSGRCHPIGAIGIVDIAGSVVNDEDMVGLGNGTRRGTVATLPLLLLLATVEAHRRSFGVARHAQ